MNRNPGAPPTAAADAALGLNWNTLRSLYVYGIQTQNWTMVRVKVLSAVTTGAPARRPTVETGSNKAENAVLDIKLQSKKK